MGTYWKLVELAGLPPLQTDGSREPHLRLQADGSRLAGSSGCNAITGTFLAEGDSLRLRAGPMTRMACTPALMHQEAAFVRALEATRTCRVASRQLDLIAGETVLARFDAISIE